MPSPHPLLPRRPGARTGRARLRHERGIRRNPRRPPRASAGAAARDRLRRGRFPGTRSGSRRRKRAGRRPARSAISRRNRPARPAPGTSRPRRPTRLRPPVPAKSPRPPAPPEHSGGAAGERPTTAATIRTSGRPPTRQRHCRCPVTARLCARVPVRPPSTRRRRADTSTPPAATFIAPSKSAPSPTPNENDPPAARFGMERRRLRQNRLIRLLGHRRYRAESMPIGLLCGRCMPEQSCPPIARQPAITLICAGSSGISVRAGSHG